MGDKYKVKKDDLRALFATAEMVMENRYHELYGRLDWKKGSNGNYFCWNTNGHSKGVDVNPSLSVDNRSGKWHCFTCGIKGNIQSYWKEYLKNGSGGDSYTDWLIDFLGLSSSGSLQFSTSTTDPDYEKNSQQIKQLYETLQEERFKKTGKKWILSGELCSIVKETQTIPMDQMDEWVDMLLADPVSMNYLFQTRRINEDVIKKYRIGLNKYGKFMFPVINADGQLINVKAYDPRGEARYKWSYPFKGYENGPVPINNFTQQKIYFFGGEPDCYCAIAMGITGAVTFGSEAITDVDKAFGPDRARQVFQGKEVVICLDSDDPGVIAANKLAASLYPYAKQIKIINLDKSEINPRGLDPELTKEVGEGEKKKLKRIEKDFTDFVKKNGFDKNSIEFFNELIENTIVYTQNIDRVSKERFKVTLQESRYPRYFSSDGSKILEIIASVGELNNKAYMCCKNFSASCATMTDPENTMNICNNCMLPRMPGFEGARSLDFHFVRDIPDEQINNPLYVKVSEHDSLGLIEALNGQKEQQQKKLCGINRRCDHVVLIDGVPEKLLHVTLKKDINEYVPTENITNTGGADIDVDAYMVGEKDIYPNKTYRFEATQTTAWNGQHAVLFIHKAEPIETCIDTFKMDQQSYELLQVFKPKDGESIDDHLKRRYDIFADAAGITGRKEMFFLGDLTFFSAVEINNKKLLPGVKRGWVETLIAGDTRTCKSMVAKFLHNHYKVGDMITGSTAVTRSGLMGGITKSGNKQTISWGKLPMNDQGMVIIDELSNIREDVLSDMTGCRSDGIVSIDTIVSGKALARTRKLMLSNQREWKTQARLPGMLFVKKLCFKDEILARFDLVWVARREDVNVEEFKAIYEQIATEFTEYQCQNLIRFIYSRKPDDFVFEDGFEELINKYQIELTNKFHPSTQLVNQEMRAKLVRLSVSLASMLFSTTEDDWNKILVKKEHLDHVVEFVYFLYCHKNMQLDVYSDKIRQNEILGDMSFMENISEYIDLNQLDQTEEFTDKYIQQMFFDYLYQVQGCHLSMPDARNDHRVTTGIRIFEGASKLIGVLTSRHCMERTPKGTYKKTEAFTAWISKRLELGEDAPKSNILEFRANQENSKIIEASKKFIRTN